MNLTFATELSVETAAYDDPAITIRVIPPPDRAIVLQRAQVDYHGSEEDWRKQLERYRKGTSHEAGGWATSNLLLTFDRTA